MLKISSNPTFQRTIKARVPVDGGYSEDSFKVTFKVLSTDEINAFDLSTETGTREFLTAAIESLDDIAGEDGKPLPYSDGLRDQVLGLPYLRTAMITEYFKSVSGAPEGN